MIQATELRIGNWADVFFDGTKTNRRKIIGEDIADIENNKLKFHSWEPIPLTPEILEKCGFNNTQEYHSFSDKGIETRSIVTGIIYNWNPLQSSRKVAYIVYPVDNEWVLHRHIDNRNGWQIGITFKYLHQLQNLYFALTGEELICTL